MKLIYPVRNVKISQLFGPSSIDYSRFGLKGHNGIDFAGQIGDEILAAADGTVIHVGYEPEGYGHFILIDHGQHVGVYAHLKKILVNVWQRVAQGKQIAEMGNSGNSTGPHLHFGIRPKNYDRDNGYRGYVDPQSFFTISTPPHNAQLEGIKLSRVKILYDGVAVRSYPGITDNVIEHAREGYILLASDTRKTSDNLSWRLCFLPVYIAETDGVKPLIAEVDSNDD